jgi:hypothetical protein
LAIGGPVGININDYPVMAKRTSKAKKTAAKKTPKKKDTTKKRASKKTRSTRATLTEKQKRQALKKLSKIGQRPSHPTKHLGPVIPLDMGPPEKPKAKPKKKKTTARKAKAAKKRRR